MQDDHYNARKLNRQEISKVKRSLRFLRMAEGLLLSIVICLSSCSSFAQSQQSATSSSHSSSTLPVQGLYEGCPLKEFSLCFKHLQQMADAGFKLVLNYDQFYGTAKQELAYAEQSHALGLKIIWALDDPTFWDGGNLLHLYDQLATTCKCSDNTGFTRYVISLVKKLPATWGYYVGDEVRKSDYTRMKAFADLVKSIDPTHPRLFVSGEISSTMGSNLKPFADTAEVVGSDMYPIGTTEQITSVGEIARAVQSIADHAGKQSVFVLQAFSWAEYPQDKQCCSRFPTEQEMRQMRDLVLENAHPKLLLWYSYYDIFKSTDATAHWKDLLQAAGVSQ